MVYDRVVRVDALSYLRTYIKRTGRSRDQNNEAKIPITSREVKGETSDIVFDLVGREMKYDHHSFSFSSPRALSY